MTDMFGFMVDRLERRLDRSELDWVLERASVIDAARSEVEFSGREAMSLAGELGIRGSSVLRAIGELDRLPALPSSIPGVLSVQQFYPTSPSEISARVAKQMRSRWMDPCGTHQPGCWVQERDWWPDVRRIGSETHVVADVFPSERGCRLQLTVDLRPIATAYGTWSWIGAALGWFALASTGVIPALVVALAVLSGGFAGYRIRVAEMRPRLEAFLDAVAFD
jgi:hypothetical protein